MLACCSHLTALPHYQEENNSLKDNSSLRNRVLAQRQRNKSVQFLAFAAQGPTITNMQQAKYSYINLWGRHAVLQARSGPHSSPFVCRARGQHSSRPAIKRPQTLNFDCQSCKTDITAAHNVFKQLWRFLDLQSLAKDTAGREIFEPAIHLSDKCTSWNRI
jgi:hypothetical protein